MWNASRGRASFPHSQIKHLFLLVTHWDYCFKNQAKVKGFLLAFLINLLSIFTCRQLHTEWVTFTVLYYQIPLGFFGSSSSGMWLEVLSGTQCRVKLLNPTTASGNYICLFRWTLGREFTLTVIPPLPSFPALSSLLQELTDKSKDKLCSNWYKICVHVKEGK